MKRTEFLDRLAAIRRWKSGGQRAPHKPLLLLLALARVQRGEDRLVPFTEVEERLERLLVDFGPPRKSHHPEYPFWHLRSDGLWTLEGMDDVADLEGSPSKSVLRSGVEGGFPREIDDLLREDSSLISVAARTVLDEHFAPTLHEDLQTAVGLVIESGLAAGKKRDPNFRLEVLRAYEYRCAMCGYDGQLETTSLGVEAAHVRWWAYGGADDLSNALALCALHHRAFDGGAISLDVDGRMMVTRLFRGGSTTKRLILDLHGRSATRPQAGLDGPSEPNLRWHHEEVFKGPARMAAAAEGSEAYDS
ncbi:MAG: HNH endonuclease [Thermoanaerobaculia bacterium]|nr:HNH endonuclease [Thermoanaerobaculia bacterium]